jgi:hypothetical protein
VVDLKTFPPYVMTLTIRSRVPADQLVRQGKRDSIIEAGQRKGRRRNKEEDRRDYKRFEIEHSTMNLSKPRPTSTET